MGTIRIERRPEPDGSVKWDVLRVYQGHVFYLNTLRCEASAQKIARQLAIDYGLLIVRP